MFASKKCIISFPSLSQKTGYPAAFCRETLLNGRWLLDGIPSNAEGFWHDVLKMNAAKQHVFLQRILFIFEITRRKAGKAQILRVSQDVWDMEANVCCLAMDVMEAMNSARDDNNLALFEGDTMKAVLNSFIEGYLVPT